jgi:hypothetical protein
MKSHKMTLEYVGKINPRKIGSFTSLVGTFPTLSIELKLLNV